MTEPGAVTGAVPASTAPWQQRQWQRLLQQRSAQRMPHALLCRGPAGVAKTPFATALAQLTLCHDASDRETACGQCRSCIQFQAGLHPDYRLVKPEDGKKVISVDQVRAVIAWLIQTSHYPGPKVMLMPGAERMHPAAANALLKTLEEPPGDALLILVSDRPGSLLATIRSRCQGLSFGVPRHSEARAWVQQQAPESSSAELDSALALAAGAPLLALEALREGRVEVFVQLGTDLGRVATGAADPVVTAAAWTKQDLRQIVNWMLTGVQAMIRVSMAGNGAVGRSTEGSAAAMPAAFARAGQAAAGQGDAVLFQHLDRLSAALGRIHAGQNPNPELLMESLFIPWQPAPNPRRTRQ